MDNTTTLELYFSCLNFSSTTSSHSQDLSTTFTLKLPHSFFLQHYFYQRKFNYEFCFWNFELRWLPCVVLEAESNKEGVRFIEGRGGGHLA